MEENRSTEEKIEAQIRTSRFEKLENFWYHYKWHTLIALFLAIAVTVCAVQLATREKSDVQILYAGSYEIGRTSSGGIPPYETVKSSLCRLVGDLNEDGKTSIGLLDLFLMTTAEIENWQGQPGEELNLRLLSENEAAFSENLLYSDYYVYILSTSVYEKYKKVKDIDLFLPLADYATENAEVSYYDDSAIFLSSTEAGRSAGLSAFPADTVICLRTVSAVGEHFNKTKNQKNFAAAQATVRALIGTPAD